MRISPLWRTTPGSGNRSHRPAAVQIRFTGGGVRNYLVVHRGGTGGAVGSRDPQWWARTLADTTKRRTLDLRREKDVRDIAKMLTEIDLTLLIGATK